MKKYFLCLLAFYFNLPITGFTQNALPNPGFEQWTTTGTYENPNGWNTVNNYSTLMGVVLTSKAIPPNVHSGNFAMKTETVFIGPPANQPIPGLVTTGTIQITTQTIDGGIQYSQRPDSIAGWYKYSPVGDDTAYVTFFLFSFFRDTIGRAIFAATSTNGNFLRFSAPLVYEMPDNPFTAYFVISPSKRYGAQAGSALWLDDMEIVLPTGIENIEKEKFKIYPNPSSGNFIVEKPDNENLIISISDATGRKISEQILTEKKSSVLLQESSGFYIVSFLINNEVLKTEKLFLIR